MNNEQCTMTKHASQLLIILTRAFVMNYELCINQVRA